MDFRNEFPVTNHLIFLNHANVAPLSRRACEKVVQWAKDITQNGDAHLGEWFQEIEGVRGAAARLLGASPAEIAFLKNTSEGLSLVAEGFPWQPGDNVVIVDAEYPANIYPWMHLHTKGVLTKIVKGRGPRIPVESLAEAIDERTRLLSISFVQSATGFRSDLGAIGDLCRARRIDFCVDAIQGLGVFPIDVKAMQIDYLSANSHKWLVSPQGAAIFYACESKRAKLRPTSVGWKSVANPHEYSKLDFRLAPDARRFECGSFIVPSIVALGGSLSLLEEIGITTTCERVKLVTDYLVERLTSVGARVLSSREEGEWSGIVSFEVPGQDAGAAVQRCANRNVVISQRDERLRASPHLYNNREDIDRLIEALKPSSRR